MKKQLTLADGFLVSKPTKGNQVISVKAVDDIKAKVRIANKYVFDEAATLKVAEVVNTIPQLLLREHKFARPPYELTWIEYPHHLYWRTLYEHAPNDILNNQNEHSDFMVGYLFDHNNVYTIGGGTLGDKDLTNAMLWPLVYELNTEWPMQEQIRMAELLNISRMGLDEFFWGSTIADIPVEYRRELRAHNGMYVIPMHPWIPPRRVGEMLRGASGDLRTVIAMLLMLNRPSITQYKQVLPNYRSFIKGKLHPFVKHTQVTVNLDPMPVLRLIGTPLGESVGKRWHEVEGHYCHDKTARDYQRIAGCIHSWVNTNDEWTPSPAIADRDCRHWLCSQCAGKRWWTKEHWRGNPKIGVVVKDQYNVTK